MIDPFKDNFAAFKCMFTEKIAVSGNDFHTSLIANVFPEERVDAFEDVDPTSDLKQRNIIIPKNMPDGWQYNHPIQIGHVVTTEDNKRYAVTSVTEFDDCFSLNVRSIAND